MSNWNNLPHEVLLRIVDNLGFEPKKINQWMFVNRQCHEIYQSAAYKRTTIRRRSNIKFDDILKSPFRPGKWVNHLVFENLVAPENFEQLNPTTDPLHLIMKHCPNVISVDFLYNELNERDFTHIAMTVKDWAYFTVALINSDTWKLRSLSCKYPSIEHSACYFNCALNMKQSLEELHLVPGMISKSNYNILLAFEKLKVLNISNSLLEDLVDCDAILQYVPHLTTFNISGFKLQNTRNDSNSVTTRTCYKNIKLLSLSQYMPSKDQDLIFIMDKFTGLDSLKIYGIHSSVSLPIMAINQAVMKSFFAYIQKISTYDIYIMANRTEENWNVIDAYNDTNYNCIEQEKHKFHLSIEFETRFNFHKTHFQKNNDRKLMSLSYNPGIDMATRVSKVNNTLSRDGWGDIQKLHIIIKGVQDQIESYIYAALRSKQITSLQELDISGGIFQTYSPQKPQMKNQPITHLKLSNTRVQTNAISLLSQDFPHLEYVEFENCQFRNNTNSNGAINQVFNVNNNGGFYLENSISMPDTTVGTFKLTTSDVPTTILISVSSASRSKYYISTAAPASSSDFTGDVIKKSTYDGLKSSLNREKYAEICLHAKSFKRVSMNLSVRNPFTGGYRCRHEFEILLP